MTKSRHSRAPRPTRTAPEPQDVRHLSSEQLAARYGPPITEESVKRWRKTGTGPQWFRVGKHVRYRLADVEAWEKSRLQPA